MGAQSDNVKVCAEFILFLAPGIGMDVCFSIFRKKPLRFIMEHQIFPIGKAYWLFAMYGFTYIHSTFFLEAELSNSAIGTFRQRKIYIFYYFSKTFILRTQRIKMFSGELSLGNEVLFNYRFVITNLGTVRIIVVVFFITYKSESLYSLVNPIKVWKTLRCENYALVAK